jgi:hypothetical protein
MTERRCPPKVGNRFIRENRFRLKLIGEVSKTGAENDSSARPAIPALPDRFHGFANL